MKAKKFVALTLVLVLVFALAAVFVACEDNSDAIKIKVWVSNKGEIANLTQKQIERFNQTNGKYKIEATIDPVSESKAAGDMVQNMEIGADLFCFAQDQLARLVAAGVLSAPGNAGVAAIEANNDAVSVEVSKVNGKIRCYPLTSDNGYFMMYDKSVIDESHIGSLELLLEDCEKAGKTFSMKVGDDGAWYAAGFFFGTGCVSNWDTDSDAVFTSYTDTYNSDNGVAAMMGIQKVVSSPAWKNTDEAAEFNVNSAVVITGTWDVTTAKKILGQNYGVAKLPKFTVGGTEYQIGSFSGCKMIGIKKQPASQSEKAIALHELAIFLTNEECQLERYQAESWGPSNIKAQQNAAVMADPTLIALREQNQFSVPQGQFPELWWTAASNLGASLKKTTTEEGIRELLSKYASEIKKLVG